MSEDRAVIVIFPDGDHRWGIQRADGQLELGFPTGHRFADYDKVEWREEWSKLWKDSKP